jgi:hypothetical protein
MNILGLNIELKKNTVESPTLDRTKEIEQKTPRPLTEFIGIDTEDGTNDVRQRAYRQRTIEDLASWWNSLTQSELTYWRWRLIRVYKSIMLDTTLKSTINYFNDNFQSIPYHFYNKGTDEINLEQDFKIQKSWFRNLQSEMLNCDYWGPTVFCCNSIQTDGSIDFTTLERWFYQPESGKISWVPAAGGPSGLDVERVNLM